MPERNPSQLTREITAENLEERLSQIGIEEIIEILVTDAVSNPQKRRGCQQLIKEICKRQGFRTGIEALALFAIGKPEEIKNICLNLIVGICQDPF